jgi:NtrC-family two-component system sensor histidine kinase KinB
MKIKVKLFLGIGLLFAMIILLTALSSYFINRLSSDTKNILVANYNTLDYSRKMQIALNNGIQASDQKKLFEDNLKLQRRNITEVGEKELTDSLNEHFRQLQRNPYDTSLMRLLRDDISDITLLNMQAIERKSKVAGTTADNSILWVSLIGVICFLIAFVIFVNLPGNIANPIKELTASIKQIAAQNYGERVHFEKHNEFGELASSFNTMAEKLQEYQAGNIQKLMMEKKRIETLINNMHDPVIGLDEKKVVLFMNNTALKIAGLNPEDVIGKPVQNIAVNNDLVRLLIRDLFSEKVKQEEKQLPLKIYSDNKESYFEREIIPIKIIPTGEKEEKLIGNVILLQNITPYKELDFAKTNFIATVSHELKTPISSIKMSLQLLENKQVGFLNAEQQSLLDSIKEDAGRLLKITAELLNMTQVESGNIQLSMMPSDPKKILMYAVNATKTQAEEKHIKLDLNSPDNIPKVQADNDKTAWVLTNLISNAIRYSYENSTINLSISQIDDKIKIAVKDIGQGIAPQFKDKIFNRYFRVPGTKKEGTGLGLAISKEFIEAQGGQITVDSEFGTGSVFSIILLKA